MSTKKNAEEKFNSANSSGGKTEKTDRGVMYISTPKEIGEIIREIPKGKLIMTTQIIEKLTKKHGVDWTCQLTTGIFIGVLANWVEEKRESGDSGLIPYWRVIKPKGYLYDKYLGSRSHQYEYLQAEGYDVTPTGKKTAAYQVKDFEKHLVK